MEYGNHKITENFSQPTFFPDARSVVPSEKPPRGSICWCLRPTSPNAWAERNLAMLQEGKAVFDKNMDMPGPVPLVVLATIAGQQKKPDAGQKEENAHGKDGILVVAGNSQFVSNPYFNQYGNGDFFLNTVNFLADEANLITFERPNTHKPLLLTGAPEDDDPLDRYNRSACGPDFRDRCLQGQEVSGDEMAEYCHILPGSAADRRDLPGDGKETRRSRQGGKGIQACFYLRRSGG